MSAVEFDQAFLRALQYGPEARELMIERMDEAKRRAQSLCPRSDGSGHGPEGEHLADHIDYEFGVDGEGVFADLSYDARFFYGRFIELGTEKMPPHPFLRPAVT